LSVLRKVSPAHRLSTVQNPSSNPVLAHLDLSSASAYPFRRFKNKSNWSANPPIINGHKKDYWCRQMPSEIATAIAYVGAFVGLIGGGVALFNSWKALCWKRAELANNYLKDFNNSPELTFAGRCLDWNGGKLVLPDSLRPYMSDGVHFIQHDRNIFAKALRPDL